MNFYCIRSRVASFASIVLLSFVFAGGAVASPEAITILTDKSCGSCHIIPGVKGAYSKFGPSLKKMGERSRIVGGALENTPENMKLWLTNPKKVKSGTLMPNMGLTEEEIDILIKYFDTI